MRSVLVDASASVVRRRPRWLPWVRARLAEEAVRARETGAQVAVVVFAAGVDLRLGPSDPSVLIDALEARGTTPLAPGAQDDGRSDLAGALEVAAGLALDPTRPPGEVVILGDGAWNGVDPAPAAAALVAGGVALTRAAPPAASLPDAAVLSLELPPLVEVGAPLVARITLDLRPPGLSRGVLFVEVDSALGLHTQSVPFVAPPGGGRLVLTADLGRADYGRTAVSVRAVLEGGPDPLPENDRARAVTVAEGELIVGAVTSESSRDALERWIARGGAPLFAGMQVLLLDRDELVGVLDQLDLLVSFDLPLDDLPAELLEPFVRRGGGWLVTSGWGFLGDWSPGGHAGPLHELLPLRPAPLDAGPRDVVLLVDGSGSMSGEPFDLVRSAAVEMVAAALPRDRIQLRFFTEVLEAPHLLAEGDGRAVDRGATREAAARRLLAARAPGGSTWILSSLEQLVEERESMDREALILLLTDGQESGHSPDPEAKAAALVQRLGRTRARLRVIAVGADADLEFLGQLVQPGEQVVPALELEELELIFQREVNRARVLEASGDGDLAVLRRRGDPGSLAESLLAPEGAPALAGLARLVRDEARPGATVLWETESGDPVLAVGRADLGRTAVFASAPRESWAGAWVHQAERFGALLRWLGRGRRRGGPSARVEGDHLWLEDLVGDWPPRVEATLVDPLARDADRVALELSLAPLHPLDPGARRRRTRLPDSLLAARAGRVLSLLLDAPAQGDTPAGPLALRVEVPVAAEFRPRSSGVWDPPPAVGPAGPGGGERAAAVSGESVSRLGPPLLGAGLVLLLLAAIARPWSQARRAAAR